MLSRASLGERFTRQSMRTLLSNRIDHAKRSMECFHGIPSNFYTQDGILEL